MAGARGGGAAIEGVSDLRFRLRTLKIGICVSHGMCLAIGIYVALTWERLHRTLIVWMLGLAVAWSLVLWRAPIESIVRGGPRRSRARSTSAWRCSTSTRARSRATPRRSASGSGRASPI